MDGQTARPVGRWRCSACGIVSCAALLGCHWLGQCSGLGTAAVLQAQPSAGPEEPAAAARALLLSGRYEEAHAAYVSLTETAAVVAAIGQARCTAAQGQGTQALELLTAALEQAPESADLHAELARLRLARGQLDAAAEHVQAALEHAPEHVAARFLTAELAERRGDLAAASAGYKELVDFYNQADVSDLDDLLLIGQAAAQHARWERLPDQFEFLSQRFYPQLIAAEERFWPAHLELARLFLEKFNQAEAERQLQAALEANPFAAEVHATRALFAVQRFELDAALLAANRALQLNPECLTACWARADCWLADYQATKAAEELEAALPLDPTHEGTLGRLAAAYAVLDGDLSLAPGTRAGDLAAQVLARNPHAGLFHEALAQGLEASRRFPAAAEQYRAALAAMPQRIGPQASLGLMLMRLGAEAEARPLLEAAFTDDPFHVRVSNTLKVLDVLDEYAVLETEHFLLRFDRVQDAQLARYMARFLEEEVYPKLTAQFGFEPAGKSLFEVFNRSRNTSGHGWFSARMVGLPYVGTVGACAGKIVALAAPSDLQQPYNWARVVQHEFVHVLNLQQTDFKIPHWYTEALATLLEDAPRPQAWEQILVQRRAAGTLYDLATLNRGFVRPQSSDDWTLAYCQAELYAEYFLQRFGDDALARLLNAYAENLETPAALQRAYGESAAEIEAGYAAYLAELVAGLRLPATGSPRTYAELVRAVQEQPDDLQLLAELAVLELQREAYPQARRLCDRVLAGEPKDPLASYVRARLHLLVGEAAEALAVLEAAHDPQRPHRQVVSLLAGLRLKLKEYPAAIELYSAGAALEPGNVAWLKSLAKAQGLSGDRAGLPATLERLAELEGDEPLYRQQLAALALAREDFAAAEAWAWQTIQIDVRLRDPHEIWAKALAARGEYALAVEEYRAVTELAADDAAAWVALARACVAAEQPQEARTAAETALRIDPQQAAAQDILEHLDP